MEYKAHKMQLLIGMSKLKCAKNATVSNYKTLKTFHFRK